MVLNSLPLFFLKVKTIAIHGRGVLNTIVLFLYVAEISACDLKVSLSFTSILASVISIRVSLYNRRGQISMSHGCIPCRLIIHVSHFTFPIIFLLIETLCQAFWRINEITAVEMYGLCTVQFKRGDFWRNIFNI